jgi:ribonuclease VapC
LSTVTLVEARVVIHGRRGRAAALLLDVFEVAPPGPLETEPAYVAVAKYGKGMGHPAKLNLGDLFSYALAKSRGLPLLYKGNDFAATDIESAVP